MRNQWNRHRLLTLTMNQRCQQAARALGFCRVVHALMDESNNSLDLSGHYAKPFRRYMLFARKLNGQL